jgi:MarR-like DNA-binding transcriptional regulator SgrR of sgrS sRNA
MDKNLLTLWQSVPSGNIKKEELAAILGLSAKQTSRHVGRWASEGWFHFVAGRGRGNVSSLQWLKNVEQVFEQEVMELINREAVEQSSKYLVYDWSQVSKMRLLDRFRSKFGFSQDNDEFDKLIIPRRYRLMTMNPLESADVHSANFVATVFNRLVFVDPSGQVWPELAHSWDISSTRLRLYLKKGVKFHDGSLLSAEDTASSLERIRNHENFKELWQPVERISVPAPLVVDIEFPDGCSYCLQMLGMITSSIFKETNGRLYGTGSFFLDDPHELKTVLLAFNDYFGERPLLDAIEFVQVPEDFDISYRSSRHQSAEETFLVESDSGVGMVFMNLFRDSPIKRQEVREYIHWVIAKHRHSIGEIDSRILPNAEGMLIGRSKCFDVPPSSRPYFERPLIIKTTSYLTSSSEWLKRILELEGVPVEMYEMHFSNYLVDNGRDQEADLYIHGEVFEMNQDFSFFYFMKNGFSPLSPIIATDDYLCDLMKKYVLTPFERWHELNLEVERHLLSTSAMIPLYYAKRQIPFSTDLENIESSHFGYVDFSKLWVRPSF